MDDNNDNLKERTREGIKNIEQNEINSFTETGYFLKSYLKAFGIIIAVGIVLSYSKMILTMNEYKENWDEKKCKPEVLFLGGFIKHDYGDGFFEKINKSGINFRECVAELKGGVVDNLLKPFENIVAKLTNVNGIFGFILDTMRGFFNAMIELISIVISNLGQLKNFFLGILNIILMVIKSVLDVFISIMGAIYEVILTIYDIFKFYVGFIGELLSKILTGMWITVASFFALAAVFFGLSFLPFFGLVFLTIAKVFMVIALITTAAATALTIVSNDTRNFFSILAAELETPEASGDCVKWDTVKLDNDSDCNDRNACFNEDYIVSDWKEGEGLSQTECRQKFGNEYTDNFKQVNDKQPYGWLYCFHPDTILKLKNGKHKKVPDIQCGDLLSDGSTITATMKINAQCSIMYDFNGVIVTGSHRVKDGDGNWIPVSKHHDSVCLGTLPISYVYCFNTDSKIIRVTTKTGTYEFMDWDEVGDMDFVELKRVAKDYLPRRASKRDIHRYLDGGFHGDTLVDLDDGRSVKIKDLEVNDLLRFGERVMGIVKIDARNLDCVKKYRYKYFEFIGGPNVTIYDQDVGNLMTLDMDGEEIDKKPTHLYHVFTNKGGICIDAVYFYDYNACMELFLDEPCVFYNERHY